MALTYNNRIETALEFSILAHASIKQVRKYSRLPYSEAHCIPVALLVSQVTSEEDGIIAALTHDILEDVAPQKPLYGRLIKILFGENVFNLVKDLTDVYTKENYPDKNRSARKLLERQRLGGIRPLSKLIKICDLIDNTADIVSNDPKFAITYIKEKHALLPYLKDESEPNSIVYRIAKQQIDEAIIKLNIKI